MMKLHHIYIGALALTLALVACQADDEDMEPVGAEEGRDARQTAWVDVKLDLGGEWNVDEDTRTPPPGTGNSGGNVSIDSNNFGTDTDNGWAETSDVDQIRLLTFCRRSGEQYKYDDDEDGFVFDMFNDITINIPADSNIPAADDDFAFVGQHQHRTAIARIRKSYGYEYRIIAIAYRSQHRLSYADLGSYFDVGKSAFKNAVGEQNTFQLNAGDGMTLRRLKATFLREYAKTDAWPTLLYGLDTGGHNNIFIKSRGKYTDLLCPPQLFWGECHLRDTLQSQKIIKFSERNRGTDIEQTGLPICGTLYRGMAKIEVQFQSVPGHRFSGGVSRPVGWIALLAEHVIGEVQLDSYDRFLPNTANISNIFKGNRYYYCIGAKKPNGTGAMTIEAYLLPCKTRLALRSYYPDASVLANKWQSAKICVYNQDSPGTAIGVISPDALDDVFYLRRNHKYVIKIPSSDYICDKNEEIN